MERHAELGELQPWLPEPVWVHRDRIFHADMELVVGPAQRDYSPPPVYRRATDRHRGKAKLGPAGTLVGYVAGQPFPMDSVDCQGDPAAGTKIIWNFTHRWQGFGADAHFRYSYIDRGELLPLLYRGRSRAYFLKHRPEPQFSEQEGDVFQSETRYAVIGFDVEAPPEARGTRALTYRYEASFGTPASFQPEDTWVYLRDLRRIRKVSETQRSAAVAGTDFSFDDLFSFSGLPPQYEWSCLGETEVLAPVNTQRLGYPYTSADRNGTPEAPPELAADFGPSHLSFANDRWELRRAIRVEMKPKDPTHPYRRKVIWLDRQTLQPLYSFAYDRNGELWKIIYHNHRWSEDDLGGVAAREWYPGWENVPEPRDLRTVSDAILNVQTGTGNRLDFWDSHGTMPSKGTLRRFVDVQALRRGR